MQQQGQQFKNKNFWSEEKSPMSMPSRIKEAINYAINQLGKSGVDLAGEIGVSKSRISQWGDGSGGGVGAALIFKVARATQCSAEWIAEGTGPMRPDQKEVAVRIPIYHPDGSNEYQSVSKGLLGELHIKTLMALTAPDDGMAFTINAGDLLLMDIQQTSLKSGCIYAVSLPDGSPLICRMIQRLTGGWTVRFDNDDKRRYRDEQLTAEAAKKLNILGRIVWHSGLF